jgi:acetylglutamate kinase
MVHLVNALSTRLLLVASLLCTLSAPATVAFTNAGSSFQGVSNNFGQLQRPTFVRYKSATAERSDHENGAAAHHLSVEALERSFYQRNAPKAAKAQPKADPSQVEFVTPRASLTDSKLAADRKSADSTDHYPFAAMMQGAGPYIANHAGKIAVFHIPGELFDNTKAFDSLLQDMALCWLLDMKLVLVIAGRFANTGECVGLKDASSCSLEHPHECRNALKATSRATMRLVEEEAGFLRTEMERKLNRCLRAHGGTAGHEVGGTAAPEANIVSGNFYTAQRFGVVRGMDFEYTGFCSETHAKNIRQVLDKGDVVLLSTVGLSPMGDLVNVNGYHLAASVAASLQASKVIYMAHQASVLQKKSDQSLIQELPLSFALSIASYHQVVCSNMGFATFQKAKDHLESSAVELLLHMAWSSWAVARGAQRAHIVNPFDGALLEELFTAKNGENTCIYHDDELLRLDAFNEDANALKEWDDFFESVSSETGTSFA